MSSRINKEKNVKMTMPENTIKTTPMMQQYLQIKKECPDAILFYRMGDFYEMFLDDAKIASAILGLTLTSRSAAADKNRVPMCGLPYHAADTYINRLIEHSYKVAICEQVEDPKLAKGIVKRAITRVITPGTLTGAAVLHKPQNNYLVSVYQQPQQEYGLAVVDLSTGEFKVVQLMDQEKLLSEITRLAPAELLICPELKKDSRLISDIKRNLNVLISDVEPWSFDFTTAYQALTTHFKVQNLRGFGCENMPAAICAAGAGLRYLQQTQKAGLLHINQLKLYSLSQFMILDSTAQRNLELVRTMRGDKKLTLLSELDFTLTPMGRRMIVQWIQQPLLDIVRINERLDAIEFLSKNKNLKYKLDDRLKNIIDLERLLGRISLGSANARDIFSLGRCLKFMPDLKNILKDTECGLLEIISKGLDPLDDLAALIDTALREDAPLSVREAGMFKNGYNQQLDELLALNCGAKQWIANLQQKEIKRTGINSLKIKYNKIFGYYIEITKANMHLAPQDYMRKQ
ncbi:MAG: DNA mismatch repair protein MutS, partial [Candidatus Omnitrophota bacterium]